jgi:hypothetical protein
MMEGSSVRGRISRLFAASMLPLAGAGHDLESPAVRLEPPPLEAPPSAAPSSEAPVADLTPLELGAETLTYTSTGTPLASPLGTMRLSNSFAAFEQYKGHMTLEFAGFLPNYPGYRIASEFLSGASVYRVTNAEQFFSDNPMICGGKPLKFIVTKLTSLADVRNETMAVNLWLLSLDDYGAFGPWTSDPCGGDTYKAAKR